MLGVEDSLLFADLLALAETTSPDMVYALIDGWQDNLRDWYTLSDLYPGNLTFEPLPELDSISDVLDAWIILVRNIYQAIGAVFHLLAYLVAAFALGFVESVVWSIQALSFLTMCFFYLLGVFELPSAGAV